MKNVRDILNSKPGGQTYSIEPGAMVVEALKMMAEKRVGALLVLESGKPVGIFSERDYARKIALLDRSSRTTEVRQVMTADIIWASPSDTMEHCMELMTEKDAVKCAAFARDSFWYLPVEAQVDSALGAHILDKLEAIHGRQAP